MPRFTTAALAAVLLASAEARTLSCRSTNSTTPLPAPLPADVECPAWNGSLYNTTTATSFQIECGTDFTAGDMHMIYTNTIEDCINACDTTPGCVGVSRSGNACYLKNDVSQPFNSSSVTSAQLVAPKNVTGRTDYISCPSWNGTWYNYTLTGSNWQVNCDMDHAGGDLSMTYTSTLEDCISACDYAPGCVDVVLRGNACYLKSSVGPAVASTGLQTARLIAKVSPALYNNSDATSIANMASVARTNQKTSKVAGKSFDRFVTIWMENTDFSAAKNDPNLAWLATKGITLGNYYGVTHPSEPNYIASISGDHFGMEGDEYWMLPNNVSSLVDLLEAKGISWAEYQEDLPYTGFQGFSKTNANGKNDYVRKHNPAILLNSVAQNFDRLANIKNLTEFYTDLNADALPQWMFITPNMTSDGHDTSVTTAGTWMRNFLEPMLNDSRFMENTLVLVTFDESHTYTQQNRVFSILLGDSVPGNLTGTTDNNFYDHYSEISTVEANWGLDTLGRWDVGANVFQHVAQKTGDVLRTWNATQNANGNVLLASSYPGVFSDHAYRQIVSPNINLVRNGRKVWQPIQDLWKQSNVATYYTDTVQIPDGANPPAGW